MSLSRPKNYDLAIIGAGSGGMAAARRAADYGMSVILFEGRDVGGTCVNRGCVPKKLMVHASRAADHIAEMPSLGWTTQDARFEWQKLRESVLTETTRLSGFHTKRIENIGIKLVSESARLTGKNLVATDSLQIKADNILIATGARPFIPPIRGAEHALVSDDIFAMKTLPKSIAIIGGGYIAVEFASMLQRLGSKVTIFERSERLIRPFDEEVSELLHRSLIVDGITIRFDANIDAIVEENNGFSLSGQPGQSAEIFERVLIAAGRIPNSEDLGLDSCGIDTDKKGAIIVDMTNQTSASGIFAIGDVTKALALTPVAIREARRVVDIIANGSSALPPPGNVPTAVFTTPECASIGLLERDARSQNINFDVRRTSFRPLAALLMEDHATEVFMKALVDSKTGKLLGMHFFGPHASEAVQLGAVAIAAGLTDDQLHQTMPLHPSTAEEVLGLGRRDEPIHQSA